MLLPADEDTPASPYPRWPCIRASGLPCSVLLDPHWAELPDHVCEPVARESTQAYARELLPEGHLSPLAPLAEGLASIDASSPFLDRLNTRRDARASVWPLGAVEPWLDQREEAWGVPHDLARVPRLPVTPVGLVVRRELAAGTVTLFASARELRREGVQAPENGQEVTRDEEQVHTQTAVISDVGGQVVHGQAEYGELAVTYWWWDRATVIIEVREAPSAVRLYQALVGGARALAGWYAKNLLGRPVNAGGRPRHSGTFEDRSEFLSIVGKLARQLRNQHAKPTQAKVADLLVAEGYAGGADPARQLRQWCRAFDFETWEGVLAALE